MIVDKNTEISVQKERNEIKNFTKAIPLEKFKNGDWFISLINFSLKKYKENINAEYFKKKYPGVLPDAIIDRRISIAKKYAAIEGGTTASAYSSAIAATIGTNGGSSPITVPAAAAAILIDLSYTSYLQLQLAYDISVLYGRPLDFEDPEDLYDLLTLAFGVKAGESFQQALQKMSPEATRIVVKKVFTGDILKWIQALPVVGRYLLQRNIIKISIPVISIGLATTLNYYFVDKIGKRAKRLFRSRVQIEEITDDYNFSDIEYIPLLLSVVWTIINADGKTNHEEAWYLKSLIQSFEGIEGAEDYIKSFSNRINFSKEKIIQEISTTNKDVKKDIFQAASMAAIIDHKLDKKEEELLKEFAVVCECEFDKKKLIKLSKSFLN